MAKVSKQRLRLSRQANAYFRLAAKASNNGQHLLAKSYLKTAFRIQAQAERS